MPSRRLKLLLRNFPRKHLFVLSLGGFLFASLLLLSSKTFQEKNVDRDLTSILEIHDLLENIEEQAALSVSLKEAIVKKNDSLYSILNGFSIDKENIIKLVNSNNSKLLSKIQVGNKITILVNNTNKIIELKYFKDFKSGIKATLVGENYVINKYKANVEKVNI